MKTAANTVKTAAIQNADDKKKTTRPQVNKTTRGRCYYIVASFFMSKVKSLKFKGIKASNSSSPSTTTDFTDFTDVLAPQVSQNFLSKTFVK